MSILIKNIDFSVLSPNQRLELVDRLWDSTRGSPEADQWPLALKEEFERRWAAKQAGDTHYLSYEATKQRLVANK